MNFAVTDIIDGISNDEFFLEYQPICEIGSGAVVGAEALVRWRNSKCGEIINPDRFIPLASRNGLMPVLGAHVILLAFKEISICQSMPSEFFISVNVCPSQLGYRNFLPFLKRLIAEYSVNPKQLHIEITERVPFEITREVKEAVESIRKMGCQVVLDDFGTGYMSLSKLALLDVDGIKITMEDFKSGDGYSHKALAVITTIASMASLIGLSLVVERVETIEQKCILSAFPGVLAQGYCFGRPEKHLSVLYAHRQA